MSTLSAILIAKSPFAKRPTGASEAFGCPVRAAGEHRRGPARELDVAMKRALAFTRRCFDPKVPA